MNKYPDLVQHQASQKPEHVSWRIQGNLEFVGTRVHIFTPMSTTVGGGVNYLCISAYFKLVLSVFQWHSLFLHLDFCLTHNFVFSMIFTCPSSTGLCSISWPFFIFNFHTSNCFTIYTQERRLDWSSNLATSVHGRGFKLAFLSDVHFLFSQLNANLT